MNPSTATFGKQERIVSRKLMDELFEGGRSRTVMAFPLRGVCTTMVRNEGCPPVQVLISVPKKRLHHAVDRNRVKRQVREAYRLNKQHLWERVPEGKALAVAFIWLADTLKDSRRVSQSVSSILHQLEDKL
jgi:ribonuclease P protein component